MSRSPQHSCAVPSAAQRSSAALSEWYVSCGSPPAGSLTWSDYDEIVETILRSLGRLPSRRQFHYEHPVEAQDPEFGVGKSYTTRLSYSDMGGSGEPVIAVGGIVNVNQRFDFFALDAEPAVRLIALEFAGRGRSGWLAEMSDYHLDAYAAQLIQCMDHLGLPSCTILGSSLGGSAVIRLASRCPERVRRIVLNDSGPYIPVERRRRRAKAVARHYVFSSPAEMFRRTGAAKKHVGPTPETVLLHTAHHQTRWSEAESGRVYRHDLRALLAYRAEAQTSLDLWSDWKKVKCPVLLLHGELSDATSNETVEEMRGHGGLSVIHVSLTGHTPSLSDPVLCEQLLEWITDDQTFPRDRIHHPVADGQERYLYPVEARQT